MISAPTWLDQTYVKALQPVVELNKEGYSLGQIHKLTVPLNVFFMAQQLFKLLTLHKLS